MAGKPTTGEELQASHSRIGASMLSIVRSGDHTTSTYVVRVMSTPSVVRSDEHTTSS